MSSDVDRYIYISGIYESSHVSSTWDLADQLAVFSSNSALVNVFYGLYPITRHWVCVHRTPLVTTEV